MTWEIFFLKNHTQNMGKKIVPDPYLNNLGWTGSTIWNFYGFFYSISKSFYCSSKSKNNLKLRCWLLAFISHKAFSKNKKRSETSLPASFCACFFLKKKTLLFQKNISHFAFYELTKFHCLIVLTSWDN